MSTARGSAVVLTCRLQQQREDYRGRAGLAIDSPAAYSVGCLRSSSAAGMGCRLAASASTSSAQS